MTEYKGKDYGDKPIIAKPKTDDQGRIYHTVYANTQTNCVVSLSGKNIILPGNPKITLRLGKSKFGNEIFIDFLTQGKDLQIKAQRTDHDSVEIYFPAEKGLEILDMAVKHFKYILYSDPTKDLFPEED